MSAFRPRPLGEPIPGSPHSVSCSLPSLADVVAYEERDPRVLGRMAAGYPRFTLHPLVRELTTVLAAEQARPDEQVWPLLSLRAAEALRGHLGTGRLLPGSDVVAVAHRADPGLTTRAKFWLQHTGGLISSRAAEDALARRGLRTLRSETEFAGDAAAEVRRVLAPCFAGAAEGLVLAASGMGAMHAAFRTIAEEQAARGRTVWIQLGWLYLDTLALLRKFTPNPARDHLVQLDVTDLPALERLFAAHGGRIAGVITETPTNPLLHTADLPAIAALARRQGARLVVDPSIASPFNVDVLPWADVVVFSLTKYASHAGDVMAGAAVVNAAAAGADALRAGIAARVDAPYPRDLARLAAEIGDAPAVVARINAAVPRIAAFLTAHPAVERVWWSGQAGSAAAYSRLARAPGSVGAVVSFTVRRPLAEVYDRIALAKGPSFGMATTLLCPYVYLAHYDLLPHRSTSDELARAGLPPDLLRLSVGTEPVEEIVAALAAALD